MIEALNPTWLAAVTIFEFVTSDRIANSLEVVGFVVTVLVYRNVSNIRSDFLFAARLPQLLDDLQGNASTINRALSDFENCVDDIQLEVSRCSANLESLVQKLRGAQKRRVRSVAIGLIKSLEGLRAAGARIGKDDVRKIYVRLNGLIQDLRNLSEDQKWSTRDVG